MQPAATVITAVRNGAPLIGETIRSIQQQDFTDWEYLIVDDASTDATCEIIEAASRCDPRIRLLRRKQAGGPYAAANDALRESRAKYIFRIDADDLSPSQRFRRQLEFLAANRSFRGCVSYWQAFDDRGLIPGTVAVVPVECPVFKWYLVLRSPTLHSSPCIERAAYEEIGGYRPLPLSQDYRLWCELARRNWLGVIPEVLSWVRFHPGRSTNRRGALQRELATDVLSDYLEALTSRRWSREELRAFQAAGYSEQVSLQEGMAALNAWDELWKRDVGPGLKRERGSLRRLSNLRRWKLLRANLRTQPACAFREAVRLACLRPDSLLQVRQALA